MPNIVPRIADVNDISVEVSMLVSAPGLVISITISPIEKVRMTIETRTVNIITMISTDERFFINLPALDPKTFLE